MATLGVKGLNSLICYCCHCCGTAWQVSKLEALGFSRSDCEHAVGVCHGQLDKAASWLTKNVTPVMTTRSHSRLYVSGFEVPQSSRNFGSVAVHLVVVLLCILMIICQ